MPHYLPNKKLESDIAEYHESKRNLDRIRIVSTDVRWFERHQHEYDLPAAETRFELARNELTTDFYLLATNVGRTCVDIILDVDDALQEVVVLCWKRIERFCPGKGKAFNYLTTCIIHHLRQMWRTHRSYKKMKYNLAKSMGCESDFLYDLNDEYDE